MDLFTPLMLGRKHIVLKAVAILLATICLVGTLSQTAQAENTFVINDGEDVKVHTSYSSNPKRVLKEAGVTLSESDIYTTEAVDGVSEITVQRLQNITVYRGEETLQTTSYGESLQEVLVRLGVTVDETQETSLPLDTATYDGMEVRVSRKGEYTESYTVEIPYETTYCEDPTLPEGEQKVLVTGKVGQMLCTANVVYVNGEETERRVYRQSVTNNPVNQVVAVGTGEQVGQKSDEPLIGDGVIVLPTGEVLTYTRTDTFIATAYTHTDDGCDEITANGAQVKWGVVAVDPGVIPYGTRMFIVANDGSYVYGLSTAEDCGGAIQDKRLDLYMATKEECFKFGVKDCTVYFLGDANWQG